MTDQAGIPAGEPGPGSVPPGQAPGLTPGYDPEPEPATFPGAPGGAAGPARHVRAESPHGAGIPVDQNAEPFPAPAGPTSSPGSTTDVASSTADVAKEQAAEVKDTAVEAGKNVAGTAKEEAANVAAEAKDQARSLVDTVTTQVNEQAGAQQQRIVGALHSLAKELGSMASSSSGSGPLTDLASQAARKGGEIAHWMENHEPRDVLVEVKRFASRRPLTFLLLCGVAGVLAGRVTRGAIASNTDVDSPDAGPAIPTLAAAPSRAADPQVSPAVPVSASGPAGPGLTDPYPAPPSAETGTAWDPARTDDIR